MPKKQIPEPKSVDELIEILQRETAVRSRTQKITVACAVGPFLFVVATAIGVWIATKRFPEDMISNLSIFACLGGAGAAVTSTHKKMLEIAAKDSDPRLTGYFIEALSFQEPKVVSLARETLTTRLPALDAGGYESFTADQKARLCRSIQSFNNPAFTRAVVDTMQQYSGKEAIAPLESLVKFGKPKRDRAEFDKIRVSAQAVLADVRMRLAQGIIEKTEAETAAIRDRVISELPVEARLNS